MSKVKFYKATTSQLSSLPLSDGQLIFTTDDKNIYLDMDNQRLKYPLEGIQDMSPGTTNGTVKIFYDGTNKEVAVQGLQALAFKAFITPAEINAISTLEKGAPSGVATLDENGQVPTSQLPDHSNYVTLDETQTITGTKTFSTANSLVYSGIEAASLSADRPVWFAKNDNNGIPVYNNNFKYNPSTKTLTVENVSGNASTATSATKATGDKDGNQIDTTYLKRSGGELTGTVTRALAGSGVIDETVLFAVSGSTDGFKVAYKADAADAGVTVFSTTDDANAKLSLGNYASGTYKQAIGITNGIATTTTQTQGDNSTKIATTAYVDTAIENLPEPMVFKGSLGENGTITELPIDGSATIGDTYKVITAGTYDSKVAKVGDTFICLTKTSNLNTWELIPSGDEPSGTVTSITLKATSPIAINSSSAITTSGTRTISHADSGVTAGTYTSVTVNATGHVTAATNPTTLAGYGITDAKIESGVITLGSNTIEPVKKSGDTMTGLLEISKSSFAPLKITRSGSTNAAGINFSNSNGTLGYIGMSGSANGGILRFTADSSTSYTVLDTGNYTTTLDNRYVTLSTSQTITGIKTFSTAKGFTYSGIETASSNATRAVWFSDNAVVGRPVINATNFTYNPSTNILTTGTYTSSAGILNLTANSNVKYNSTDKCIEFNFA